MRTSRIALFVCGAMATQLMLGCHRDDSDDTPMPLGVEVPSALDHPSELVGIWQEAKGKQTIDIKADGTCEMTNQVSMGAPGATTSSEQKIPAKWGTKDDKFYFAEIRNSLPLSYDWKLQGGKLTLSNNGSKLSYTQVKEEKK